MNIPLTLCTKEIPIYTRMSVRKWNELRCMGQAPQPKYRGGEGNIYLGRDIERFLGLIDETQTEVQNDPFIHGAQNIGKAKR